LISGKAEVRVMSSIWKSLSAGIMIIIAGLIGIGGGALVSMSGEFTSRSGGILGFEPLGVTTIILGIVAVLGGIFALRRRLWPLAIAGAVCAIPCMPVLGIVAMIFISLADEEFEQKLAGQS